MAYPIKTKRGEDDSAKANKMLGKYKDGGAVKDGTNIHISINAAPKPAGAPGGMPDPALASALAQAAQPPPAPMGAPPPDMSGGMGGPPLGPGAGPGPIAMRRGGKVSNKPTGGETSAATKTRGDKIRPVHKTDTVPAKKSAGGVAQLTNASGGAGSGGGRLKKAHDEARGGH